MLRFVLLGPFRAERDGAPIPSEDWPSRQTRTVLKILVDSRDHAVPADRLIDLVWQDAEGDTARNSLHAAIRTLRRILEPGLARGAASTYIRTEDSAYRFAVGNSKIDVDEHLAALRAAREHDHRGESHAALEAYARATSLYAGEYLADEPYADWAIAARERLRADHLDAVARLGQLLEREGRAEEMVAQLERGLAADHLREDLYRLLMRAHALAGRRAHALSIFDRYRRALQAELGTPPSAELRRERDRIANTGESEGRPAVAAAPRFVGREREQALLRQAWTRAAEGRASLVLVTGEPGIGKTRLLRHFREQLPAQTQVLAASAYESDALSYGVAARLVETRLQRPAGLRHLQTLGPSAGVLASIVPALRTTWPECPLAPAGASDPAQALEAITQALVPAGRRPPILIWIDDGHWLDEASAKWLAYAAHRATSVLAVVSIRSGERIPPTLDALYMDLARDERSRRIEVGPLSSGEIAQLVGEARDDDRRLADRLHTATKGNPLFVIEMLRGGAADADGPLPATVRDAVVGRLRSCSALERETLAVLAVVGDPATGELVATVGDRALETTLDTLEALLARRLVRARDDGRYEIEHPLIQRVVYEETVAGRRRELHRRAAAALAGSEQRGSARILLRHLRATDAAPRTIAAAAERAGDEAMAAFSHLDAVASYEIAAESAGAADDEAGAARLRALERRGDALHLMGRSTEAASAFDELVDATSDPLVRARLLRKTALFLGEAKIAEAVALLDRAERELPSRDDVETRTERGRIEGARGVPLFYRSDFHGVVAAGERALSLLADLPESDPIFGDIDVRTGSAYQRLGDLDRAARVYQRMRARARLHGDVVMEARADLLLGAIAQHRGRLAEALELCERAQLGYERCALPRFVIHAVFNRGYVLGDLGDLAGARAASLDAIARAEAVGLTFWVSHFTVGLGGIEVRLGLRSGRRTLERGIEMSDAVGSRQRTAHAIVFLAELALLEGDGARARDEALRALELGEAIDDAHTRREGSAVLAFAHLTLGDEAAAVDAARRGAEAAGAGGFVLSEARNLVPLGVATRSKATIARAERTFRAAGARYDLAQALLARAAGAARSTKVLDEAYALAQACGAAPLAARIAAVRASSAGVQTPG